jgi:hypothetical protein
MWISVGHGPVLWGVDYGNDVWFKMLGTPAPFEYSKCRTWWEEVPEMKMTQLDVGKNGHVWALDASNQIYWREGVTETNKKGSNWVSEVIVRSQDAQGNMVETSTPLEKANQVVLCTDGQSWMRTMDNKLAVRTGVMENMMVDGNLRVRTVGRAWEPLANQAPDQIWQSISCGQ